MTKFFTTLRFSLIVIFHIVLFSDRVFAQTWVPRNMGQYSANISAMVFFNDTLYAGTQNDGIYLSADRGQNWKQSDKGLPEEAYISSFAIRNDTLFAGYYFGGVYYKTSKSMQWNMMTQSGLQNSQITSLLFLNNKLYAGTVNGVYVSSNRNAPWKAANNGFEISNTNPNTWITALCTAGNSIIAADEFRGTYRLQSNGTWAVDTTGMNPQMNVFALENIQGEIYCGTQKLYLSEDIGTTWLSIGAGLPGYESVRSISSYQTQLLVGMSSGKLLASPNKGGTWTTLFETPSPINKILVDGSDIFLGTYADGIYKSSDGGATWLKADKGIVNTPVSSLHNFNGNLYAAANEILYSSDDAGKTWNTINNTIGYYGQFNFTHLGDSLFILSNYSVSFSVDKGATWQPFTSNGKIGNDNFSSLYSYRGQLIAGSSQGIYRFDKLSNAWSSLGQFPSNALISSFLERGDSLLAGGLSDVFLSLNHGASWAPINPTTPANFYVWNMASKGSKLFASSNSGLFLSKDNGKSWTTVGTDHWGSVNTIFSYKGYLFAGTYANGVFFSSDAGDNWKSSQNGFPFPLTINSFTAMNDTIYAGTTEGVWACALKDFGPTISSFTPQSGSPGTTVTIYGTNFDSEVPYDSVYFNGSPAKIIAASDNGLSVVVPSNATTGPISVIVNGRLATTSSNSFNVLQGQTITFNPLSDVTLGDPAFTLSASSDSGLAVNYTSNSNKVTLSGNVVTIVSAGRDTITATQPGNTIFGAAKAVKQSFCIKPAKPIVTLSGDNTATPTLTSSAASGNQWFLNGAAITGETNSTLSVTTVGVYTVQTKADDCLSTPSNDVVIVVTGDINLPEKVFLYPNPSQDYVFVTGIKEHLTASTVVDMIGKYTSLKMEKQGDLLKGDISNLAAGMYMLKITVGTQVHQIKFIKQ